VSPRPGEQRTCRDIGRNARRRDGAGARWRRLDERCPVEPLHPLETVERRPDPFDVGTASRFGHDEAHLGDALRARCVTVGDALVALVARRLLRHTGQDVVELEGQPRVIALELRGASEKERLRRAGAPNALHGHVDLQAERVADFVQRGDAPRDERLAERTLLAAAGLEELAISIGVDARVLEQVAREGERARRIGGPGYAPALKVNVNLEILGRAHELATRVVTDQSDHGRKRLGIEDQGETLMAGDPMAR